MRARRPGECPGDRRREITAICGGRPDFGLLQSRMHLRRPHARLIRDVPVQLYLFDLLQAGGELLAMPYTARRERLEDLGLDAGPVRTRRGTAAGRPTCGPPAWPRPGGRQAAGLSLLSGPTPGLDQGQEHPPRRGHLWRLEARPGPPRRAPSSLPSVEVELGYAGPGVWASPVWNGSQEVVGVLALRTYSSFKPRGHMSPDSLALTVSSAAMGVSEVIGSDY